MYPISNFTKIRPVGADLIQAEIKWKDGRDKPDNRFSLLCQRP